MNPYKAGGTNARPTVAANAAKSAGLNAFSYRRPTPPPAGLQLRPAAALTGMSPVGKFASLAFLSFLFLTLSRFHEVLTVVFGVRAYLYTLCLIPLLPMTFLSGRWQIPWKSVPGMLFLGLTGWMILGFPFSIWRGGVYKELKDGWSLSLITFMIVGAMIGNLRDMRRALYVSGLSMIVILAAYMRFAKADEGRFAFAFGSLSNANDLAMHVLLGLPILAFIVIDQKGVSLIRFAAVIAAIFTLIVVMRTGSRAGLLGIAVLLIAVFFLSSFMGKVKLVIAACSVVALLFAAAPESARNRYRTLWEDTSVEDGGDIGSATASTEGRKHLLQESIRQTLKHPIFGIGPGNFPIAYAKVLEDQGVLYHRYRVSHNTYTEVSSETGFLDLFYFLAQWYGASGRTSDCPVGLNVLRDRR